MGIPSGKGLPSPGTEQGWSHLGTGSVLGNGQTRCFSNPNNSQIPKKLLFPVGRVPGPVSGPCPGAVEVPAVPALQQIPIRTPSQALGSASWVFICTIPCQLFYPSAGKKLPLSPPRAGEELQVTLLSLCRALGTQGGDTAVGTPPCWPSNTAALSAPAEDNGRLQPRPARAGTCHGLALGTSRAVASLGMSPGGWKGQG